MHRGLSLVFAACLAAGLVACSDDDDSPFAPQEGQTEDGAGNDDTGSTGPRGVVQTYEVVDRTHVDHRVDYEQTPPVGGDHASVWQNCGFYDRPIVSEAGVHSLEHGAVWITYRSDLPANQVAVIQSYADQPYTLASPWPDDDLPAPVVLSAWGAQILLDQLPDPKADEFLANYRESLGAPEPGAPCDGGTTFTE